MPPALVGKTPSTFPACSRTLSPQGVPCGPRKFHLTVEMTSQEGNSSCKNASYRGSGLSRRTEPRIPGSWGQNHPRRLFLPSELTELTEPGGHTPPKGAGCFTLQWPSHELVSLPSPSHKRHNRTSWSVCPTVPRIADPHPERISGNAGRCLPRVGHLWLQREQTLLGSGLPRSGSGDAQLAQSDSRKYSGVNVWSRPGAKGITRNRLEVGYWLSERKMLRAQRERKPGSVLHMRKTRGKVGKSQQWAKANLRPGGGSPAMPDSSVLLA